jgi:hypothetical protein
VYRPLYEEAYAYRNGGLFDLRPLHMFFDPAEWKGRQVPRFTRIADPEVIAQLEAIKARMYPSSEPLPMIRDRQQSRPGGE